MSDFDIADEILGKLIASMPWQLNRYESAVVEIRRKSADECKFWDELWEQCSQDDPVCDVTLNLDDGSEMRAHWCILLLCPYFKALRHSGLYEKNSGKLDMAMSPADVVRLTVEFLYRGKATIPKDKLRDVIHCADYLQMDNLKLRCADYLREHKLDLNNCVSMCTLASTYNLEALYDESNRILRRRFKEVMSKDDILQLVTDSLKFLMSDQNLRYVGQLELFKLLVRWAEHKEDRKDAFEELFDLIDLHDITLEDLESVVRSSTLVSDNPKCRDRVDEHLDSRFGVDLDAMDVLIFAGGKKLCGSQKNDDKIRSTACFGYVVENDRWVRLSNLPRRMCGKLAVKNQSEMFILGKEENYVSTRLYKLLGKDVKESWSACSLEQPRTTTDEVYAALFCKDKLVSVRRDNMRLFVCTHNPDSPSQSSVKNIMFLRSLTEFKSVRLCCFKERLVLIMVVTCRNGTVSNKTVILDVHKNNLDVTETRNTCCGDVFYQEGDRVFLETPGKRFSNVYSISSGRWTSLRRGLPAAPDNVNWTNTQSVKIRGVLLVLANSTTDPDNKPPQLHRLDSKLWCWTKVDIPVADIPLFDASMARFTIPRELLRCPFDCTHCSHRFVNAEYALERYGYDDEDEDDDDAFLADDDSLYGPPYSDSDDDVDFGYAPGFFFW